jgi:hypothetical protein
MDDFSPQQSTTVTPEERESLTYRIAKLYYSKCLIFKKLQDIQRNMRI